MTRPIINWSLRSGCSDRGIRDDRRGIGECGRSGYKGQDKGGVNKCKSIDVVWNWCSVMRMRNRGRKKRERRRRITRSDSNHGWTWSSDARRGWVNRFLDQSMHLCFCLWGAPNNLCGPLFLRSWWNIRCVTIRMRYRSRDGGKQWKILVQVSNLMALVTL